MKGRRLLLSTLLGAALAAAGCAPLAVGAAGGGAAGAVESSKAAEKRNYGPGTYAATILSNVAYFPAKAVFAGAGAVASGAAYLVTLGDRDASSAIWNASVKGDYVVTPDMISGNREVNFVGTS